MYLNKAVIIGNLTRDPEIKAIPAGMKVTTFSVATNRVWKDQTGAKKESTDYHNIVVFGRQAETAGQYLRKGQSVLVEGRMQTRNWDDASGVKRYRTEIIADRVQFGPKQGAGGPTEQAKPMTESKQEDEAPIDTIEYPTEDSQLEDIPF